MKMLVVKKKGEGQPSKFTHSSVSEKPHSGTYRWRVLINSLLAGIIVLTTKVAQKNIGDLH